MNERVKVEVADHVATVTLNRPDKHNALDGPMFEGILAAVDEVASTRGVRAVVLHGAGPSFCSGLDVGAIADPNSSVSMQQLLERKEGRRGNMAQRVCTEWIDLPMPVIAAIHGNCFGGGLQIALGADIRFAAPDARLSIMESKWGLVPDMGITQTLPRLLSIDLAKELTFTARIVSGEEAQRLGLVTHVADDPLAAAVELAREIAARSPDSMRAIKRLYNSAWVDGSEEPLRLETELQLRLIGSPNQMAAVAAGMTGKPGEFADPEPERRS